MTLRKLDDQPPSPLAAPYDAPAGPPYGAALAIVVAAYLALGWIAFNVGDQVDYAYKAVLWPPVGVGIAALLAWGPRIWPAIFLGELAANVLLGAPRAMATDLAIAGGSTVGAVLGAALFRGLVGPDASLQRPRVVALFITLCAAVGPLVSAAVGTLAFASAGTIHQSDARYVLWAWWSGDFVSVLILTPWLLSWREASPGAWTAARIGEFVLTIAVLVAVSGFVFAGWLRRGTYDYPLTYLPVLLIAWMASRFGFRGATTALLVSCLMAAWGTLHDLGPFARPTRFETALMLQGFLMSVAVTTLMFSAFVLDRRRVEVEAARRAIELEQQRAFERFKKGILDATTHELRTPLAAIVGNAELLEDVMADGRAPLEQELVRGIQAGADRLHRMIDELLLVGGLSAGQQLLHPDDVDVGPVLEAAIEAHAAAAAAKGVDLALEHAHVPQPVGLDAERFSQALHQLLDNAIKFTPEGGRVRVAADLEREELVVRVQDSGIGLTTEQRQHAFERFYQADPGLTRAAGGTGLGLAIAKALIEAHGGRIEVESRPGEGSTFTIRVPRRPEGPFEARPGTVSLLPPATAEGGGPTSERGGLGDPVSKPYGLPMAPRHGAVPPKGDRTT